LEADPTFKNSNGTLSGDGSSLAIASTEAGKKHWWSPTIGPGHALVQYNAAVASAAKASTTTSNSGVTEDAPMTRQSKIMNVSVRSKGVTQQHENDAAGR